MKAALYRRYGPPSVVNVQDWPDPVPNAGDVLVQVEAAGLTSGDARIRSARAPAGMGPFIRLVFGVTAPRRPILGREYAGRIVALGAGVTTFNEGDTVFGITDGMRLGAHAELIAVKASGLIRHRPEELSATEAAAFFFGGLTAADFLLDQCRLHPGERILIVGATGAVGSAAVQIARMQGAQITALTGADNLALARTLGADDARDYRLNTGSDLYDVILDVPGTLPNALDRLAPAGRLGLVTATLGQMLGALLRPQRKGNRRICAGVVKETPHAVARLIDLYTNKSYRPLLGESFPLSSIRDAYERADSGHKRGNIVLHLGGDHGG
jgi:NADPH:quinone reductase-like Zn-dependent oxidoreductase